MHYRRLRALLFFPVLLIGLHDPALAGCQVAVVSSINGYDPSGTSYTLPLSVNTPGFLGVTIANQGTTERVADVLIYPRRYDQPRRQSHVVHANETPDETRLGGFRNILRLRPPVLALHDLELNEIASS